jgi:hypothetical protein
MSNQVNRRSTGGYGQVKAGCGRVVGYRRLNEHGLQETEDSISSKLARGTFAATFFLAVLAVLEMEGLRLEDL